MSMAHGRPFTQLPLDAGESVIFTDVNGTFHRSVDFAVAITDQAFYLWRYLFPFRTYWERVPLAEITEVTLAPYSHGGWNVGLLCVACALAISFPFLLGQAIVGFIVVPLVFYMAFVVFKSLHDRTTLIVCTLHRTVTYRTPAESHALLKQADRRFVIRIAAELGTRGIKVVNRIEDEAQPCAAGDAQ